MRRRARAFRSAPVPCSVSLKPRVDGVILTHRSVLVASLDVRGCYAALAAHASQLVWFRRLFVVFSAYTYANRLVVIE